MRRAALLSFALVVLLGTLALALVGARDERSLAFTLGVVSQAPAAVLAPGATVCQAPIPVAAAFDAVELQVGTFERRGQALEVTVRDAAGDGRQLARGRLAPGYGDVTRQTVEVGAVAEGGRVAVCVRNAGSRRVALYGSGEAASRVSAARLDGTLTGTDVDLAFRTRTASGTLALVPDILERMTLFKGDWIGAWAGWLLLAAVALGAPALLGRALASATAAAAADAPPRDDQTTRP